MLACLAPQAEAVYTSSLTFDDVAPSPVCNPEPDLLIEEVYPLGQADDGDYLDMVVCVEQETHTRVCYIVKSPLGLDVAAPGIWEVQENETLWEIYLTLHKRGAGDAPSWSKFLDNIKYNMPDLNIDHIYPEQKIKYRDQQKGSGGTGCQ